MERDTAQRRAIRQVLEEAGRPLSPAEVHEAAQTEIPKLGQATVYRTLKALLEEEWIVAVQLPGEAPRYELAGKHHHHHFHCRNCQRVFEVEGCPGNLNGLVPSGFSLESHEVVLYGLCDSCTARN